MSRLTRQEMKRDEVREQFEGFVHYLTAHWKTVVAGIAAAFVAFLLVMGVRSYLEHREVGAGEQLSRAIKVAGAPVGVADPKPDDSNPSFADEATRDAKAQELFAEIQDDFGRTSAGDVAAVYLGRLALADGRNDEARELWQGFLAHRPDHVLTATVKRNLIHLDRSEGRGEEVATWLTEEIARVEGRILPEDVALWELAVTLQELDRIEQARLHYQRLLDEFPQSGYRVEAQRRLEGLGG